MIWRLLRSLFTFQNLFWALLAALAVTVVGGMGSLVRGLNYSLLVAVMLGGIILGRVLARIRPPWWLALLLMIGSGFTVVLLLVGRLLSRIWAAIQTTILFAFALWRQQIFALPDVTPLQTAGRELLQGGTVVLSRLWNFLVQLGENGTPDPLPIQLIWGWTVWVAIAWAAYMIWQNKQALIAVIPLGILMTVAMFFTGIRSNTLLAFLFLALVLQATNGWKRRQQRWESRQMDWATDIAQDVAFAAGVIIMLSIFLSATVPEISLSQIIKKFQFQQQLAQTGGQRIDNVAGSLGIERRATAPLPAPPPAMPARPAFEMPSGLPNRHLLQASPELSEEVIMLVKLSEPAPPLPQEIEFGHLPPPTAFYWLGTTFDQYSGRGWTTSRTRLRELAPNDVQVPPQEPRRIVTQTVRLIQPFGNFLFTTGFPLQVNQTSWISFRSYNDWVGTVLSTQNIYTAQSWLSEATPQQLRAAGTDYPDWITERYLNLPDELPNRVRALGLELTATAPTPYDRAIAIESYLRTYPYTLDVSTPPIGQDVVDYFLFDLQKGYCDYYASSMAVLARSAGLPARFVIGYAPSPYDYRTDQYVVREAEAHSWAQIYFPEYGWIDFEPTGGRSPLNREDEGGSKLAAIPTLPPDYDLEAILAAQLPWWETVPLWKILLIILAGVGVVMLIGFLVMWGRDLRLARLPAAELIPILEGRLERNARLLGLTSTSAVTPLEFKTRLVDHLTHLAQQRPGLQQIMPNSDDIAGLVNGFVGLRYSPHPITDDQAKTYLNTWQRLRWRLWSIIFLKKTRRIK
jgi:transglutaminase-like putative cysteine protease